MDPAKRRPSVDLEARRILRAVLAREGAKVRAARKRRGWTQVELARRTALKQPTISDLERGKGASVSLSIWQRVALVLEMFLDFKLGRDKFEEPRDAGHLAIQELILRLGRVLGLSRRFELRNSPAAPTAWTDVGLIDREHRRLILYECVNSIGDIGASVRSSDRKQAEAEALAAARAEPWTVHTCWVIRDTKRNRGLIARYPQTFESAFPGSSAEWVGALTKGTSPPAERGLIWCDLAATRVFARRRGKIAA
jgi:transcriptional regulator with XRE-family HTH domain